MLTCQASWFNSHERHIYSSYDYSLSFRSLLTVFLSLFFVSCSSPSFSVRCSMCRGCALLVRAACILFGYSTHSVYLLFVRFGCRSAVPRVKCWLRTYPVQSASVFWRACFIIGLVCLHAALFCLPCMLLCAGQRCHAGRGSAQSRAPPFFDMHFLSLGFVLRA